MDATSARSDLDLIRDVVRKASQRNDAHAFHCVHWGAIVMIWYPLGNWFGMNENMPMYIAVSAVALLLGAILSIARGARACGDPRLPGGNTFVSSQIGWICFANLTAGGVLSFLAPATGLSPGWNVPIIWGLVYANMAFMMGVTYSRDFMSRAQHFHVVATVQIPLTGAPWAMLQVPYPMTDEKWEEMESFLKLMRKPLTTK